VIRLVIVGAGGYGREMLDVVEAINAVSPTFEVVGFVDDGSPDVDLIQRRGAEFLGKVARLEDVDAGYVVGIGSGQVRRKIDEYATGLGRSPVTLIHPSATMAAEVEIGEGSVICSHVSLTNHIRLGRHVHLNLNCTIGHDAVLEDFATVLPGATISGNVTLAEAASIGTNAAVIQGVRVGAGTTVGAGAAVVRDLPDGVTAVGVPAKPLG
jgi:sugar O-acyltransferase (sialic acid O-acetyltransferase NeuD family)